ncbi:hypothetical protein [Kitasatospora purpeofusca]|uniref:hypothetical protein n=1 Tax=Kitasatospora purpeofusca TaxID=67352 RepID=UPI003F4AB498
MIYAAGSLETVVRFAGEMLATTEAARNELAGSTAGKLFQQVKKIVADGGELNAEQVAEYTSIVSDADPYVQSRNVYIHGGWAEINGQLTAMNRRKDNGLRTRPLAVSELSVLADAFTDLANRVFDWIYPVLLEHRPHLLTQAAEE